MREREYTMRVESFYATLPLVFSLPSAPHNMIPFSFLRGSSEEIYVCVLGLELDRMDNIDVASCLFLLYDRNAETVSEQVVQFPYRYLDALDIQHADKDTWILTVHGEIFNTASGHLRRVVDVYESSTMHIQHWKHVQRLQKEEMSLPENTDECEDDEDDVIADEEKKLLQFWSREETLYLLYRTAPTTLSEPAPFLMQRRPNQEPLTKALHNDGYLYIPYVFPHSFLVLTCGCSQKDLVWKIQIAAYRMDGQCLSQCTLSRTDFLARHEPWFVIDDLGEWIFPTMYVTGGPALPENGGPTCVAALQLHSIADADAMNSENSRTSVQNDKDHYEGGLYCINESGHILQEARIKLGKNISFCLCRTKVVGVDFWLGQWRLWIWSPCSGEKVEIIPTFSSQARRITLLSVDGNGSQGKDRFWCVEELESGIRVSLFSSLSFLPVEQAVMNDMRLPFRPAQLSSFQIVPCTLLAVQDMLLVAAINKESRLELLRFRFGVTGEHA